MSEHHRELVDQVCVTGNFSPGRVPCFGVKGEQCNIILPAYVCLCSFCTTASRRVTWGIESASSNHYESKQKKNQQAIIAADDGWKSKGMVVT